MTSTSRTRTVSLFKVAGVQVDIDFSWLVIFALILLSLSAGYFPGACPGHRKPAYWVGGFAATVMLSAFWPTTGSVYGGGCAIGDFPV